MNHTMRSILVRGEQSIFGLDQPPTTIRSRPATNHNPLRTHRATINHRILVASHVRGPTFTGICSQPRSREYVRRAPLQKTMFAGSLCNANPRADTNTQTHTCAQTNACKSTCECVHMLVFAHLCVCAHVRQHIGMCAHTRTCVHIYACASTCAIVLAHACRRARW